MKRVSRWEEELALQIRAAKLPEPVREYEFVGGRKWRADFGWGFQGVLCEVEGGIWTGGRHSRGVGFSADCEKYNAATLAGYRVFRFTPAMVKSGEALRVLEEALR